MAMKRFTLLTSSLLVGLIVLHLLLSIDYENLYTVANKGGATGIMICLIGLIALWLSTRYQSGEQQVS
jgi:hypothetical protein